VQSKKLELEGQTVREKFEQTSFDAGKVESVYGDLPIIENTSAFIFDSMPLKVPLATIANISLRTAVSAIQAFAAVLLTPFTTLASNETTPIVC